MKKNIPLYLGLTLLFVLQLVSYVNYLLIDGGLYNGFVDKSLLLKTPLIIIPILLIIIGLINLYLSYRKMLNENLAKASRANSSERL